MTKNNLSVIVILALLFAILYVAPFLSQPGIFVSCQDKSILGFKKATPPLVAVIQPEICRVEVIAKSGDIIICQSKVGIFNVERGVIACSELKKYEGKLIDVEATFFDLNNIKLGSYNIQLKYEGI